MRLGWQSIISPRSTTTPREIDELMKVRREILRMDSISGRNRKIGGSRYVSEEQELNLR